MNRPTHDIPGLIARIGDNDLIKGRTLKKLLATMQRLVPIAGDNLSGEEKPDGFVLNAKGGAATTATDCPLSCKASASGKITFTTLGAINDVIPSNLFGGGGFLTLTVPSSGLGYVVIACTASSGGIASATITTRASAPAPEVPTLGSPPTSFDVLIYCTLDGTPYRTIGCGNLRARPMIVQIVDKTNPPCGGVPSEYYYQWSVEAV